MGYKDPGRQAEYQLRWIQKRREAWIRAHGPCACGSWESLRLDSMDGNPKTLGTVWTMSAARQAEELARYRVVCADCLRHATRPVRLHGTTSMYRAGCRCDDCRRVSTAARRERRRRLRAEGYT